MERTADLCTRLNEQVVQSVRPFVDVTGPCILLDFPDHGNVGDSAIWLGERAFFKALYGKPPAFVCSIATGLDTDELARVAPQGTIFLHGGGNFGDIWREYHGFRESVLARFPGRTIVQLPQTIHFGDPRALEKTARLIDAHGKFVLCVRDHRSLEIATKSFGCPVRLVPDMAFCLGMIKRPAAPRHALLLSCCGQISRAPGGIEIRSYRFQPIPFCSTGKMTTACS